eukprot:9473148-Pyramimonas_sp.AAC.1
MSPSKREDSKDKAEVDADAEDIMKFFADEKAATTWVEALVDAYDKYQDALPEHPMAEAWQSHCDFQQYVAEKLDTLVEDEAASRRCLMEEKEAEAQLLKFFADEKAFSAR